MNVFFFFFDLNFTQVCVEASFFHMISVGGSFFFFFFLAEGEICRPFSKRLSQTLRFSFLLPFGLRKLFSSPL